MHNYTLVYFLSRYQRTETVTEHVIKHTIRSWDGLYWNTVSESFFSSFSGTLDMSQHGVVIAEFSIRHGAYLAVVYGHGLLPTWAPLVVTGSDLVRTI